MGINEPALFLKYRSLVNDALITKLIEGETELDQVLQYSLGIDAHESAEYLISARSGKRIRPILCMFVCIDYFFLLDSYHIFFYKLLRQVLQNLYNFFFLLYLLVKFFLEQVFSLI